MVSLSTNEMLHQMVENYGYGSYLFSLLNVKQLEKLQQIDPDFEEYIDDLLSDRIYDPEAKNIFIQKFRNDLWTNPPNLYPLEINQDLLKYSNNIKLFLDRLYVWINQEMGLNPDTKDDIHPIQNFKKGDVLHVYSEGFNAYYIMDTKFRNIYVNLKDKFELYDFVPASFDILGNTPANFWQDIPIPYLSFYFPLDRIFDKIKWNKVIHQNQNYLLGNFTYQKRKSKIYIPITQSTQEAKKLAISLQLRSMNIFTPNDPLGILEQNESTLFGSLDEQELFEKEEKESINQEELFD
jgi:hypothetical protein